MRPSPFFGKLPVEIRCMIYEFAYAEEGGFIKVNLERKSSGKALKVGAVLVLPLELADRLQCAFELLIGISKEWFHEAFDIFMRSKQIRFSKIEDLAEYSRLQPHNKKNIKSVSWRQGSRIEWPYTIYDLYRLAPNVDALHLFVGHGEFFALGRETLPGHDFYRNFRSLRGLRSFHATIETNNPALEDWMRKAREDGSFDANVAEYCERIRDEVTKAKGT